MHSNLTKRITKGKVILYILLTIFIFSNSMIVYAGNAVSDPQIIVGQDNGCPLYTGPIEITRKTTIKAMAVKEGMDPSFVSSTYFNYPTDTIRIVS